MKQITYRSTYSKPTVDSPPIASIIRKTYESGVISSPMIMSYSIIFRAGEEIGELSLGLLPAGCASVKYTFSGSNPIEMKIDPIMCSYKEFDYRPGSVAATIFNSLLYMADDKAQRSGEYEILICCPDSMEKRLNALIAVRTESTLACTAENSSA